MGSPSVERTSPPHSRNTENNPGIRIPSFSIREFYVYKQYAIRSEHVYYRNVLTCDNKQFECTLNVSMSHLYISESAVTPQCQNLIQIVEARAFSGNTFLNDISVLSMHSPLDINYINTLCSDYLSSNIKP